MTPPAFVTRRRYPHDARLIPTGAPPISHCRQPGCRAAVWWGETKAGKRCPFDIDEQGRATGTSHWRTCTDRPLRD